MHNPYSDSEEEYEEEEEYAGGYAYGDEEEEDDGDARAAAEEPAAAGAAGGSGAGARSPARGRAGAASVVDEAGSGLAAEDSEPGDLTCAICLNSIPLENLALVKVRAGCAAAALLQGRSCCCCPVWAAAGACGAASGQRCGPACIRRGPAAGRWRCFQLRCSACQRPQAGRRRTWQPLLLPPAVAALTLPPCRLQPPRCLPPGLRPHVLRHLHPALGPAQGARLVPAVQAALHPPAHLPHAGRGAAGGCGQAGGQHAGEGRPGGSSLDRELQVLDRRAAAAAAATASLPPSLVSPSPASCAPLPPPQDFPSEESVCLLKRARWFEEHLRFTDRAAASLVEESRLADGLAWQVRAWDACRLPGCGRSAVAVLGAGGRPGLAWPGLA